MQTVFAEHLELERPDSPGDTQLGLREQPCPVVTGVFPACDTLVVRSEMLLETPGQPCPHSCSSLQPSSRNTECLPAAALSLFLCLMFPAAYS